MTKHTAAPKMKVSGKHFRQAQLEKLHLEISALKRGNADRFGKYLPFISVMVAVGGFLLGMYQFQKNYQFEQEKILTERRLDRESREREHDIQRNHQIRTDLERVAAFSKDPNETLATVRLLLRDLSGHLQIEAQTNAKKADATNQLITDTLFAVIVNDCDFSQSRDLLFVQTVSSIWPGYKRVLDNDDSLGTTVFILAKYLEAIKIFSRMDPRVLQQVTFHDQAFYHPGGHGKLNSSQIFQLHDTLEGYRDHMEHVKVAPAKEIWIREFKLATGNPALAKSLFGS